MEGNIRMTAFAGAARLIKKNGWTRGENRGPKGEYCLLSAIEHSIDKNESFHDYVEIITNKLKYKPSDWNDMPRRTKQEVVDLLYSIHQESVV
jgi:hypothetical protein